eukprot:403331105
MGNSVTQNLLLSKQKDQLNPFIHFGDLITRAKGGDLILIQDQVKFDNYTMLNTQEAHILRQLLRFKCKDNPPFAKKLWSRIGIIIDSDIEDVKYILEITSTGIKQYEFISRMMYYKIEGFIFAVKLFSHATTHEMRLEMQRFAKSLSNKNWKNLFDMEDEEASNIVKFGFQKSNRILRHFTSDSMINSQLYQVFKLFVKEQDPTEHELIQFDDIGNFLSFLMINKEEKELRVYYLCQQIEPLLKTFKNSHSNRRGLDFYEFLAILIQVDAFVDLEITEKEKVSTITAQIAIQFLERCGLFYQKDPLIYAEDCNDISDNVPPFKDSYMITKVVKWQQKL